MSMLQQLCIMKCSNHPLCRKNSMRRTCFTIAVQWTCYNVNKISSLVTIDLYILSALVMRMFKFWSTQWWWQICWYVITKDLRTHCFCLHGWSEPSWGNERRNRSNRIGWPITATICLQMVLCYSSSSYAGVFAIFYVHNSQLHAWNPLFFFPTLGLSFIFSLQLQYNLPPSLLGSLLPWKCRQYVLPQQQNPPTRLLITKYKTTTWIFTLKKLKIS
jgi:hypothetical protein